MTKRHVCLLVSLAAVILICVLGFTGYRNYQNRFATLGEERYEKTITSIDLSGREIAYLTQLQAFSQLTQIDLRNTGLTPEEYDRVKGWFPDAQILWDIPFQGAYYDMHTTHLTVNSLAEQDLTILPYFTALESLDASECRDYALITAAVERFPDLEIRYGIWLGPESYPADTAQLVLSDVNLSELIEVLPYFTALERIEFQGILPPAQELLAFTAQHPDIECYWQVTVFDMVADVYTTELDFSGIPMTGTEEVAAAAEYLPNLTQVVMLDCGLGNDQMGALCQAYPDIFFVWYVKLGQGITVRSDITIFAPVKLHKIVFDGDLDGLRYCTKLVVIDLGHMFISDISFLQYTTELRFLILGDTRVTDLTHLSGLKKLQFLELFSINVTDFTPLQGCTALEDLNICGTVADCTPLHQMTWLKRLWHVMGHMSAQDRAALRSALPDTLVYEPIHGSTSDGWRTGYLYYEMRDLMGMPYMRG